MFKLVGINENVQGVENIGRKKFKGRCSEQKESTVSPIRLTCEFMLNDQRVLLDRKFKINNRCDQPDA